MLSATEIITAVTIPSVVPGTGAAYQKMKDPATLYALCGVAASITLSADKSVTKCRVAVTGATEHPVRLPDVEAAVTGSHPSESALANAAKRIDKRLAYRGDFYASSEYREHLTRVLTERALRLAAARAAELV